MKRTRNILILICILALAFTAIRFGPGGIRSLEKQLGFAVPTQEEILDSMVQMLSEHETVLQFDNVTPDALMKAYDTVLREYPSLFWVGPGYSYSTFERSLGRTSISMHILLNTGSRDISLMEKELDQKVSDIAAQIDSSCSDYEKVLFAHDYITQNCSYDTELSDVLETVSSEEMDSYCDLAATAYGCLVENSAICSGYSSAFKLLLDKLGIPNGTVVGSADSDDGDLSHVWNYVELNGETYYIDITWDDTSGGDQSNTVPDHAYFCVTESEISKSHMPDDGEYLPDCTATACNYHMLNGFYISDYSYSAVCSQIEAQKDRQVTEIKFASEADLERATADLFSGNNVFRIPSVAAGNYRTVWHRSCPDSCVLVLWYEK